MANYHVILLTKYFNMIRNMKQRTLLLLAYSIVVPFHGCDVARQAKKATNLVNCDFRVLSAEHINLAGISIQNSSSIKSLNLTDAAKIMTAIGGTTLPLSLILNIEAKNPNSLPAGLNKLQWILFIDDIQMTSGSVDEAFTIPPDNGTAIIPIQVGLDLKQVLKGKSLEAIVNFGFNLAGVGNKPSRIKVKLKPTIMIGNHPLTYPGYISVTTEFSGL
jgi:LEA14-like dessication related protein